MADIELDPESTAVLITDPQKDFLSPDGVAWEKVGDTVEQNRVVDKLERLRDTARTSDISVFYSPHYFNDDEFESWQSLNPIDELMFDLRMFDVEREGNDFHPDLEPDDNTFVLSPHKQHSGFWANDVQIQLRQRGIDTIVLAGMSANLPGTATKASRPSSGTPSQPTRTTRPKSIQKRLLPRRSFCGVPTTNSSRSSGPNACRKTSMRAS